MGIVNCSGLFSTLLQAKGNVQLDRDARPLLLVEDPRRGCRSHYALSVAWHLLNLPSITNPVNSPLMPAEHAMAKRIAALCSPYSALDPVGLPKMVGGSRFIFALTAPVALCLAVGCW